MTADKLLYPFQLVILKKMESLPLCPCVEAQYMKINKHVKTTF